MKHSTYLALVSAVVVLSIVAGWQTRRLYLQERLSSHVKVDWTGWSLALVLAYAGLALVSSWVVSRDRMRDRTVAS